MLSRAKFRPILDADWSDSLGENRPDQRSQTQGTFVTTTIFFIDLRNFLEAFRSPYLISPNEIRQITPLDVTENIDQIIAKTTGYITVRRSSCGLRYCWKGLARGRLDRGKGYIVI